MKITEVLDSQFDIQNLLKWLDKSPEDELYTTQEISSISGISESTIKSSRVLEPYRVKFNRRNYFGNLNAVKKFKKQVVE